jgi:hypothetical protein
MVEISLEYLLQIEEKIKALSDRHRASNFVVTLQ